MIEHLKHRNQIHGARDDENAVLVSKAVHWAMAHAAPEATDLYAALVEVFCSAGNSNAAACDCNRAIEIVVDAYLQAHQPRAAA